MKLTSVIAVLCLSFAAASVSQTTAQPDAAVASSQPAINPERQATSEQVRQYFALVGVDTAMKNMLQQSFKGMQATAAPYIPATLWDDMQKTFHDYDLMSALVPVYQRHISKEDMTSILAFYQTSAGKRLIAAQPTMQFETETKFRAIGQRLGAEVVARHAEEIAAARKDYEDRIVTEQNSSKKPD